MAVLPGNGIFVLKGELSYLMIAMRRGTRWSLHSFQDEDQDPLIKRFQDLKALLNVTEDLRMIEPIDILEPFLAVIKSEDTTGPVTNIALSSVHKFLAYGLIDPNHSNIPQIVKSIADAVTHARFVGTDPSSDSVVLMKILQVLRTLTLSPEGASLTNENLCEILLSCFKICFETKCSELLRKTAESYLKDMVQLVFTRLPLFSDSFPGSTNFRMRPGVIETTRTRRKSFKSKNKPEQQRSVANEKIESEETEKLIQAPVETPKQSEPSTNIIVDMQGSISQENTTEINQSSNGTEKTDEQKPEITDETNQDTDIKPAETEDLESLPLIDESHEYVNPRGIRFTPQNEEEIVLIPYGLASVRELFRFLISLCNPMDKQNTELMTQLGLNLLTVAFEVGADSIGKYESLLALVRDDLCRNLFSLLNTERVSVFAADLQLSFLMFESQRTHLKFQLEYYLMKLIEIIVSDSVKVTYEHKEIALDNILQMWRIPGLVTELYLNYDCDMYCSNLYEDLTKLLAKNAFPVTAGIYNTHLLSLDALLTVIKIIESNCDKEINLKSGENDSSNELVGFNSRLKISEQIPTREELSAIKNIKKWLPTGTEHFNLKPKKGIQFLQEHGVLKPELDPLEIATFLRENPSLDKKMIGEYISSRHNLQILGAFVKTFDFKEMRIDEALRLYLETFRLPGEAGPIAMILEHFADRWRECNGFPFEDADAAFTLAYAVIMLNVDQHNHNVKKQNIPMTPDDFKKNLKKVNGGNDFDPDMLDEMYNAIKNDEIVMPAEQTGLVRENYLWKVLLRRGASKNGNYVHVNTSSYDSDLFTIIWGPILSALSFVFDRSDDSAVYKRAIQGFERCAFISSHFNMSANLDMLIMTLSKFTLLHNQAKNNHLAVQLGSNGKAQLSLKTVFSLIHRHGDNIREGWKSIFDIILTLYSVNLLPKSYVEAEDFTEPSGRIVLVYEDVQSSQKQDSGLFSSLYSYMVSSENLSRIPSQEEQECVDEAKACLKKCNLEQMITDSKFLHDESLAELVKALVELCRGPELQKSLGYVYNENVAVFFLELLLKVVIQNRDRVMKIWQTVRDHLYTLVMNASHCDYQFLLERSVIGLLRLAIRLMRNEEMSPVVLQSLRMLLLLKSATLHRISRQISFGLYELLKTSAQNIHTKADWSIIFTLLECVGAGAQPPRPITEENQADQGAKSEGEGPISSEEESSVVSDRGYTSDSELSKGTKFSTGGRSTSPVIVPITTPPHNAGSGWILVGKESEAQPVVGRTLPPHQYSLSLERNLGPHDKSALVKCCESLAFLVRDVAHITPYNFDACVHCIRTFVEASLHGVKKPRRNSKRESRPRRKPRREQKMGHRSPVSSPDEDTEESDEENLPSGYHQVCIQLLDLMHTLHTRTAQIFRWWAEEGGELTQEISLWTQGWCPLLQGIARLCCDTRKQVRLSAISYLQRALLVHDLQTLTAPEWEACFYRVLFPLLMQLLEPLGTRDAFAVEETRMRAATVLSKVFLHHLNPLLSLPTFGNVWLTILDFMDRYMHAENSDVLFEAIPESLKNMLLVMESAKVFEGPDGTNALWGQTWDRIGMFLPHLKDELFKERAEMAVAEQAKPAEQITPTVSTAQQVHPQVVPQMPQLQQGLPQSIQTQQQPVVPQLQQQSSISTETPQQTENSKQISNVRLVQHTVENATRSSIILQPPSSQHTINSPLFAHLGQMVSTPIGPPIPQDVSLGQQSPVRNVQQPSFQGTVPPFQGVPNSHGHTFPVLFNQPPQYVSHEVQPSSLYTEYIQNPYNVNVVENKNFVYAANFVAQSDSPSHTGLDDNRNPEEGRRTVFQSSNYFYGGQQTFIPPGSEILFGADGNAGIPAETK